MSEIIECSEAWARFDPAEVEDLGAGSYLLWTKLAKAAARAQRCEALPTGVVPADDAAPVATELPVLWLAGEGDPQDPPANLTAIPTQQPNARPWRAAVRAVRHERDVRADLLAGPQSTSGDTGPPIPGSDVRLAADGEILVRGGHVFAGYVDDRAATAEAIDRDGWLRTGDLGKWVDDGLRIMGRKKQLIITTAGEQAVPDDESYWSISEDYLPIDRGRAAY